MRARLFDSRPRGGSALLAGGKSRGPPLPRPVLSQRNSKLKRALVVSQPCAAAPQMGRRASLSIHGPDRTAELSHYAIGDSAPTLRVGRNLHEHRRAGGPFVSSTRDRGRDRPVTGAVAVRYLRADKWRRST